MDTKDNGKPEKSWQVLWRAFSFLLACFAAFLLEYGVEHLIGPDIQNHSSFAQTIFSLSGLYQRLVTAGPRKPVQKFTVLVDDDPTDVPH